MPKASKWIQLTQLALLFVSVFSSLPACAIEGSEVLYCGNLRNFQLGQVSLRDTSTKMTCDDLVFMDEFFGKVSSLSPYPLTKLNYLIVANRIPVNVGDFDGIGRKFDIGYNPLNENEVKIEMVAFAHETGHAIFQAALDQQVEFFGSLKLILDKQSSYFANYVIPIFNEIESGPDCRTEGSACFVRVTALQERARSADSSEAELKSFYEAHVIEAGMLDHLLGQYNELYADVTASIYFENPDAVSESFKLLGDGEPIACRSFSTELAKDFRDDEVHCALSLLRTRLWKNWIYRRIGDKRRLLKDLANAFILDINTHLAELNAGKTVSSDAIVASLTARLGI